MALNQPGQAAGSTAESFGGLCFNGHDVPPAANFCPECGAPTPNSGRARAWPQEPPPYQEPSRTDVYGPAWGYGAPRPATFPYWAPGWGPLAAWSYWTSRRNRALNPLAVISLACAFSIFLTGWWGAVAAIVTGHVATVLIRRRGQRGRWYAGAGLAIGYFALLVFLLWDVVPVTGHIG